MYFKAKENIQKKKENVKLRHDTFLRVFSVEYQNSCMAKEFTNVKLMHSNL